MATPEAMQLDSDSDAPRAAASPGAMAHSEADLHAAHHRICDGAVASALPTYKCAFAEEMLPVEALRRPLILSAQMGVQLEGQWIAHETEMRSPVPDALLPAILLPALAVKKSSTEHRIANAAR